MKHDEEKTKALLAALSSLADQVGWIHARKGVGLFVCPGFEKLVHFPFEVNDKVIVNDAFELRDVIANVNKLDAYRVLLLSKGQSRLFNGSGVELTEVVDERFPDEYEEEFQVEKAHPGSFYNGEESKINQARVTDFFRKLDSKLGEYPVKLPVILIGVEKFLSTFRNISHHSSRIIGEVTGNYDRQGVQEIVSLVWPVMEAYLEKERQATVEAAKNAIHQGKAVSGIQEVWDVARQGIGSKLLVERDFVCKAYIGGEYDQLVLDGAGNDQYREVPDAVEAVMDTIMDFDDTQITIVDHDQLKDYGRIMLTTKY